VFFALAYLISFIRWASASGWRLFGLCLAFGILGCLTKITTFVIPLLVAGTVTGLHALMIIRAHCAERRFEQPSEDSSSSAVAGHRLPACHRPNHILPMLCLMIIPVIVGYLYLDHGNRIKEQSPFTAWLSLKNPGMKTWNYGTLSQRLDPSTWRRIAGCIRETVLPFPSIALVAGLFLVPFRVRGFKKLPFGNLAVGCSLALAPFMAILVFYNLYWVHSYYFIALAPLFALFTGVSCFLIYKVIKSRFVKLLFILLLVGLWVKTGASELGDALRGPDEDGRVKCLRAASKLIGKNEPVIVLCPDEWSAFIPYYLQRPAFMGFLVHKPVRIEELLEVTHFKAEGFRWLITEGNSSEILELAEKLSDGWKSVRRVPLEAKGTSYVLYSLSDK